MMFLRCLFLKLSKAAVLFLYSLILWEGEDNRKAGYIYMWMCQRGFCPSLHITVICWQITISIYQYIHAEEINRVWKYLDAPVVNCLTSHLIAKCKGQSWTKTSAKTTVSRLDGTVGSQGQNNGHIFSDTQNWRRTSSMHYNMRSVHLA